jgi:DNA-directed RNA polymerase specialized sigma24 family protein
VKAITDTDFEALIRDCFRHPGDVERLARFNGAFRPYLLAVLASLSGRDPSLAEDACQAALLKFIGIFRDGPRPGINYKAYFLAIAKHSLIDEARHRQRHVPMEVRGPEVESAGD